MTILLVATLAVAVNIQQVMSEPTTIYVDDDNAAGPWDGTPAHPYQNITSGLEHAIDGDTIFVYNGTYYEHLEIDKSVSFVGEDKYTTIVDGQNSGSVFIVPPPNYVNITISGFTIQNGYYYGIRTTHHSNNNTIEGNIIRNCWQGLEVTGQQNLFPRGNKIENNDVLDCTYGILVYCAAENTIVGNRIEGCSHWGILLTGETTTGNVIRENAIDSCGTPGVAASVEFQSYATNNVLVANNITNGGNIAAYIYTTGNSIYHNNIINATAPPLEQIGYKNAWDNGYPHGGNYWSNYSGADSYHGPYQNETGSDGIGDTPYTFSDNMDRYPLAHPWSSLPVHNLNTGLGYAMIQDAINATETLDGHLILADAGTYNENVTVHKAVFLCGADQVNSVINSTLGVIIAADNVTITHFKITEGISADYCDSLNIEQNSVVTTFRGIELYGSNNSLIVANDICGLSDYCYGVMLRHCYFCEIQDNIITNMVGGVGAEDSESNLILRNQVFGYSQLVTYEYGFVLSRATRNMFIENTIEQCQVVAGFFENPADNIFYHNDFLDYDTPLLTWFEENNTWDDGYPSGGNYWSGYTGTDLYSGPYQNETGSDGIGDAAYVLYTNNTDNYPLIKRYGSMHDIGIADVTNSKVGCLPMPTVGKGYTLNITVRTLNYGATSETFDLTVYANSSIIQTVTGVSIDWRNSTMLHVTCSTDTLDYGNYTLSICAGPVTGETDTTDNAYYCWILVTIPGDIDGSGGVDIFDAIRLSGHYDEYAPWLHSELDRNIDLNDDGGIDIYDAILLSNHYDQYLP